MRLAEFKKELSGAQETIGEAIKEAERQKRALGHVNYAQKATRKRVVKAIEDPEVPSLPEVIETIQKLNLIQKILTNIHLNLGRLKEGSLKDLRPNQWKALQAFVQFLKGTDGLDLIGYFKQPTGAGKTILFGVLTKLLDVRTLILVPRNALLEQTREELCDMLGFKEEEIGVVGDGKNETQRNVTISTYQSHLSKMKSRKVHRPGDTGNGYKEWIRDCELVICDEGHRSMGHNTRRSLAAIKRCEDGEFGEFDPDMTDVDEKYQGQVLNRLREYIAPHAMTVGVSATPRLAHKSMDTHFNHLIAEESFGDLVKAGTLTKFKIVRAEGVILEEEAKRKITDEQEEKILEREFMAKKLLIKYKEVKAELEKNDERLFGVAFCPTITECDRLATEAKKLGFKCEVVTTREKKAYHEEDHLPKKDRKGLVKMAEGRLLRGATDLIVTVDMLTEGWNCRPPNCAIINRITYSEARAIQGPGRVARAFPGKKYAYVFEGDWKVRRTNGGSEEGEEEEGGEGGGEGEGGSKGISNGRKPLTLAAALHAYGENVEDVCEGVDGEKVEFENGILRSNPNGIIAFRDGKFGILPAGYAKFIGCATHTLKKYIREAEIDPLGLGRFMSGPPEEIFPKDIVDELQFVKDVLAAQSREVDKDGIVMVDKIKCIAPVPYAAQNGMTHKALKDAIEQGGVLAAGKARNGPAIIDVYPKSQVDKLQYVKVRLDIEQKYEAGSDQVNDDGTFLMSGGVLGVSDWVYAGHIGISGATLRKQIAAAKLKSIGTAKSGGWVVDIYRKSEVDALEIVQSHQATAEINVGDDGIVKFKDESEGIGVAAYCKANNLAYQHLMRHIEAAGIMPICKARRGSAFVNVYPKAEVEGLEYVTNASKTFEKVGPTGEVLMGRVKCVSLKRFSGHLSMGTTHLEEIVTWAALTVYGQVKSGPHIVDVYEKNAVLDAIKRYKDKE